VLLNDKYTVEKGSVYLTGIQALVRLPVDQMRRDRRAGLNTGTFISGYEGSPLGGYDLTLQRNQKLLDEYGIHFRPGVNEDLAATSVMGSQIFEVVGKSKTDGVLGIWYGKGPGVDRSGDIFRHANLAGTGRIARRWFCAATTTAARARPSRIRAISASTISAFPFLYPGNTQEIIDYGLLAIALSRHSGAWVGLKLVTDICDGGGTVSWIADAPAIRRAGGLSESRRRAAGSADHARPGARGKRAAVASALEFARLNGVNRWRGARDKAWLGIASAGKSYYDLAQALRDLGIGEVDLAGMGIRIAKFGMTFPMDAQFARDSPEGLETILVIEEKRSFLELHLRDALYALAQRPQVLGKSTRTGAMLLPPSGELDPDKIAKVVGGLLAARGSNESVAARVKLIDGRGGRTARIVGDARAELLFGLPAQ
jgi:indolepyruvate ferredoxin oxidoreductase